MSHTLAYLCASYHAHGFAGHIDRCFAFFTFIFNILYIKIYIINNNNNPNESTNSTSRAFETL